MFKGKLIMKTTSMLAAVLAVLFMLNIITASADGYVSDRSPGSLAYMQQEMDNVGKGSASVSYNGTVNYSYSMGDISLVYSSSSGWNVSGASSITRSTRNGVPKYNAEEDTFLLDNQELEYLAGTNPREYRTRKESWQRVYYYNPDDAEDSYWIVEKPDGSKAYYGCEKNGSTVTPSSIGRFTAIGGNVALHNNKPRGWGITEEWSQGNYDVKRYKWMHLGGDTNPSGQYCLSRVVSGKASAAQNGYTATRLIWSSDNRYSPISYISGSKVRNVGRLSVVMVQSSCDENGVTVEPHSITEIYVPEWIYADNGKMLLEKIQPFAQNGVDPLPPVTFEYYDIDKSFELSDDTWYVGGSINFLRKETMNQDTLQSNITVDYFDIDGDGLPDRVEKEESDPDIKVKRNNGAGFDPGHILCLNSGPSSLRRAKKDEMEDYDMFDVDEDGLPDRLYGNDEGGIYVRYNLGNYEFGNPEFLFTAEVPGVEGYTRQERYLPGDTAYEYYNISCFLDMDGDGRLDWIKKGPGEHPYPQPSNYDNDLYVRRNLGKGNGFQASSEIWRGSGNTYTDEYEIRSQYIDFNDDDERVRVHVSCEYFDINGDGLPDRVIKGGDGEDPPTVCSVFLNNGAGFEERVTVDLNDSYQLRHNEYTGDAMCDFIDMNGDGLLDRAKQHNGELFVSLNKGNLKFGSYESWGENVGDFLREFNGLNSTIDYIDMNGDGCPDRVNTVDVLGDLEVWYNQSGPGGKLKSISDGQGGYTGYTYKPLNKNDNPQVKPSMWVIETETIYDTMPDNTLDAYTTFYDYKDGVFDCTENEFRGFGIFIKTSPTGEKTYTYYNTDPYYEGLPESIDVYNCLDKKYNTTRFYYEIWDTAVCNHNMWNENVKKVFLKRKEEVVYDGNSTGIINEFKYDYDLYGNLTFISSTEGVTGKKVVTKSWYNFDEDNWNVRQLQMSIMAGPDRTGQPKVQKGEYFEYTTTGKLRKKMNWLQTEDTINIPLHINADGTFNKPATNDFRWSNPEYYYYDIYGNINKMVDPEGNETLFTYDTKYGKYLIKVENAKGHITWNYYDNPDLETYNPTVISNAITRGQLSKTEQQQNGTWRKYYYDDFGRLERELANGASFDYPTVKYEYINAVLDTNGRIQTPRCLKVSEALEDGNPDMLETYTYFDGLGRKVQVKKEHTDTDYSTVDTVYWLLRPSGGGSEIKILIRTSVAYTDNSHNFTARRLSGPATVETSWMDSSEGWITEVTKPDYGTVTTTKQRTTIKTTDQNGNTTINYKDGFGQTLRITEPGGAETRYWYDTGAGKLTQVRDDKQNNIYIYYDSLGQKRKIIDPDMGITRYTYDRNGNVTHQTDASGDTIRYEYDELNRLIKARYPGDGNYDEYIYDGDLLWKGTGKRVYTRVYREGTLINEKHYRYDVRGNIAYEQNNIDGKTRSMIHEYDYMDRIALDIYDRTGERLNYYYDSHGNGMKEIINDHGDIYVSDVTYLPYDKVTTVSYGNGMVVGYGYWDNGEDGVPDSVNRYLLKSIYITGLSGFGLPIYLEYDYDDVGNVTWIGDYNAQPNEHHYYTYDGLNRLTEADSTLYGLVEYGYDSIGNMTEKDGSTYCYGGDVRIKPHAVKNDGTHTYLYDAKGNMSQKISYQSLPGYVMSIPEQLLRYAVYGTENVTLNDRATVKLPSGAYAPIASNGQVSLGSNAISGDIIADNVWLRDAARVYGSIQTRHTITKQNATIVKGIEYEGTSISNSTLPNSIPSNNLAFYGVTWTDTYVNPGQSVTLTPGTYWNYGVNSGGELNLESGEYYFNSLTMNSGTTLNLDETNGPVTIYVQNNLTMRALINHSTPGMKGAANLLIGYVGTQDIYLGGQYSEPFRGSVIAPNASIIAGQECRKFEGMYIAKKVNFHQDSKVTYVPFSGFAPQVTVYTYDWNNRLIEVQEDYETTMKATYDVDGERIKKEEGDTATYYFFPQLEEEYEISTGVMTDRNTYYYLNGEKFARRNNEGLHYYINDHLGSTIAVADDSGNAEKVLKYMPYGAEAFEDGTVEENYRFTGKEKDSLGLYYYGARYYDSDLGRFITADSFVPGQGKYPQGLNRYSYCYNNPLKYVDPTGHAADQDFDVEMGYGTSSDFDYIDVGVGYIYNYPFCDEDELYAGLEMDFTDYLGQEGDYGINMAFQGGVKANINDSVGITGSANVNYIGSRTTGDSGRVTNSNMFGIKANLGLIYNSKMGIFIPGFEYLNSKSYHSYGIKMNYQLPFRLANNIFVPTGNLGWNWERSGGEWNLKPSFEWSGGVKGYLAKDLLAFEVEYSGKKWTEKYDKYGANVPRVRHDLNTQISVRYPKSILNVFIPNTIKFNTNLGGLHGQSEWGTSIMWNGKVK